MKSMTTTIYYGKDVPNLPVLKAKTEVNLTATEIMHAKKIASEFLNNTLISKTFFDSASISSLVEIKRKFTVIHPDFTLKEEIIEYAALTIFGHLFIDDLCPDILDLTLSHIGTKNLVEDPALQEFVKGTPKDIFEITLKTRALY